MESAERARPELGYAISHGQCRPSPSLTRGPHEPDVSVLAHPAILIFSAINGRERSTETRTYVRTGCSKLVYLTQRAKTPAKTPAINRARSLLRPSIHPPPRSAFLGTIDRAAADATRRHGVPKRRRPRHHGAAASLCVRAAAVVRRRRPSKPE
jgi:hypothetical protein